MESMFKGTIRNPYNIVSMEKRDVFSSPLSPFCYILDVTKINTQFKYQRGLVFSPLITCRGIVLFQG